jgi:hypothetical protein
MSFMCMSGIPYVVKLSINAVSPSLAMFGAQNPDIVTVDLQSDKYLNHSVIQFLVSIVSSYLVKSASKIGLAVPHSS